MYMLLMLLAVCLPGTARAEGFFEANLPTVVTTVVLLILMIAGMYVWKRYISVYLERFGLNLDAETVVRAVEAIYGRGNGDAKWKAAIEAMDARGWNVNVELVTSALRAAWSVMNTQMCASGEKETDKYKDTVQFSEHEQEVHED